MNKICNDFLQDEKYYKKEHNLTKSPSEVKISGIRIIKSDWIGSAYWKDKETFDDFCEELIRVNSTLIKTK